MKDSQGAAKPLPSHGLSVWVFIVAVFACAYLLFLVQPLVGKRILPWFGGAPGVWILCLAFYQTVLFLGYAYAHLLIRFTRSSQQLIIHGLVLLAAIAALPVLPGDDWKPDPLAEPSGAILSILSVHVALPFLALAATGPLVQVWFARRYPDRSPYPLYAVSNFGSLLALLAYPILIEPRLGLDFTGTIWSIAFFLSGGAVLGCAFLAWKISPATDEHDTPQPEATPQDKRPGRIALWFLLPGCAVILLMGMTNQLCLDIASVPFLWILPLATYLISFIVAFGSENIYSRGSFVALSVLAYILFYGAGIWEPWLPEQLQLSMTNVTAQISFGCLLLFAITMVLHGELYRLRPSPQFLTSFYLCIAAGGALAGIFVGIFAPRIFIDYTETFLGLALAWILVLATCWIDPRSWLNANAPRWRWGLAGLMTLLFFVYAGGPVLPSRPDTMYQERNFFGILRIARANPIQPRILWSGTTLHGAQFQTEELRDSPTTYFGVASPIGLFLDRPAWQPPRRIGVIGLGVGTLATYGRANDLVRFYEIDPSVVRIAGEDGYFTFLEDSDAQIEIVPGDGRLSLKREQVERVKQDFDILIVDAFNSDAVPVHLLTQEAFEIYLNSLGETGVLALHVSNRHFDLPPIVARSGEANDLEALFVGTTLQINERLTTNSTWMFLSRDHKSLYAVAELLDAKAREIGLQPEMLQIVFTDPERLKKVPLWTDDYSDLFGALRDLPAP